MEKLVWRYFVPLHIQSECGKIRTRKNSVFRHIHTVQCYSMERKDSTEKTEEADEPIQNPRTLKIYFSHSKKIEIYKIKRKTENRF